MSGKSTDIPSWHVVSVIVPHDDAELAGTLLFEAGSHGTIEERCDLPRMTLLKSYFPSQPPAQEIAARLEASFASAHLGADTVHSIVTIA